MTTTIACFGSAHIDIKAFADAPVKLGASNPVHTSSSLGGVGRNISETLARLGCSVSLISRVGQDIRGEFVVSSIQDINIDTKFITRSDSCPTATYTALLEPNGEMVVALADMAIYDEVTPEVLAPILPKVSSCPIWIMDAGLPQETLLFIARHKPANTQLWAAPISVPKCIKLIPSLPFVDVLILNLAEYEELQKYSANLSKITHIIMTAGEEGAYIVTQNNKHFPAILSVVKDVTGAGDSFFAGVLYGCLRLKSFDEAICYGLATAHLTLSTTASAYEDMSPAILSSLVNSYTKRKLA